MAKQKKKYIFRELKGPPLTEEDLDDIARMIASWIYRDLRNKKGGATLSKEGNHE
jgi:hypothetical protein